MASGRVQGGNRSTTKIPARRVEQLSDKELRALDLAENAQREDLGLAEGYPFMQRPGWKEYRVLEAGDLLKQVPDAKRQEAGR